MVNWQHQHQFAFCCNLKTMYGVAPHNCAKYLKEVFPHLPWPTVYDIVAELTLNFDEIYAHLKKKGMVE